MGNVGGGSSGGVTLYTDAACTQAATAQQVIDAFSAGGVRISLPVSGAEAEVAVISIFRPTIATQGSAEGSAPAAILVAVNPSTMEIEAIQLME